MQDQESLAAKVGEAMRHIGSGADRLVRLADLLEKLRSDPDWSEADVMTVRSHVSLLLKEFNNTKDD